MRKTAAHRQVMLVGLFALLAAAGADCRGTDAAKLYPPPSDLARFGEWVQSGELRFRVMKVAEHRVLETRNGTRRAPSNARFVLVTVQVIPARKGEGMVDYVKQTALVDSAGAGYRADSRRFLDLNAGSLPVKIESGWFVERTVPFLVPGDFTPLALRCVGGEDAEPVCIALRKED